MTINHFLCKMGSAMNESNSTYLEKCERVKKKFALLTSEEKYQELIRMGRSLPQFPEHLKTENSMVHGCQSLLYLYCIFQNSQCIFLAEADALISKGLAALLISVYNGESPETILKCPPDFVREIGIGASLSPSRSNGLVQIHLRMKQEALKHLVFS